MYWYGTSLNVTALYIRVYSYPGWRCARRERSFHVALNPASSSSLTTYIVRSRWFEPFSPLEPVPQSRAA